MPGSVDSNSLDLIVVRFDFGTGQDKNQSVNSAMERGAFLVFANVDAM